MSDPDHEYKEDIRHHRQWASQIVRALTYIVDNPEIVPAEDDRDMLMHLCCDVEAHLVAIEGARQCLFEDIEPRRMTPMEVAA